MGGREKTALRKEIIAAKEDYALYKNPEFTEYGTIVEESIMGINETLRNHTLKNHQEEPLEDTTPFDDQRAVCIERFFDLQGRLKKDSFEELRRFEIGENVYQYIYLPHSETNRCFLIDFKHKRIFPVLPKGTTETIKDVTKFGNQIVIILTHDSEDAICIGEDGKQIGEICCNIRKVREGNVDILAFDKEADPDADSITIYTEYLGSDGLLYEKTVDLSGERQQAFKVKQEKVLQ